MDVNAPLKIREKYCLSSEWCFIIDELQYPSTPYLSKLCDVGSFLYSLETCFVAALYRFLCSSDALWLLLIFCDNFQQFTSNFVHNLLIPQSHFVLVGLSTYFNLVYLQSPCFPNCLWNYHISAIWYFCLVLYCLFVGLLNYIFVLAYCQHVFNFIGSMSVLSCVIALPLVF